MIDLERIRLVLTCESSPEQYDAFLDEWQVGYLRMRHSWFSVSFPDAAGELLYNDKVGGGGNFLDEQREGHLLCARRLIAERLDRAPRFEVGQRVRYEVGLGEGSAEGEGTIVRLPLQGGYFPAGWRYRVRHDGGDEADYVEVGVLEHELTLVEPDALRPGCE